MRGLMMDFQLTVPAMLERAGPFSATLKSLHAGRTTR